MKHIIATLTALLLALCPAKATNIDSWKNYFSYYDATQVIDVDGMLYSIMSGNLVTYDTRTTEVRYIDRITSGLSSKGIKFIGYSDTQHTIVIVYLDGNIDLYNTRTETVVNIPQFRDNPDSDFSLNNIKVQGDLALIATNEGIVAVDIKNKVIKGRYAIGKTSVAIYFDKHIYAALLSNDGKQGSIISIAEDDNLLDRTHWETIAEKPISDMSAMGDCLYMFCVYNEYTNKGDVPNAGIWVKCNRVQNGALTKISPYYPLKASSAYGRTIAYGFNPSYSEKVIIEFSTEYPDRPNIVKLSTPFNCIFPAKQGGYWAALSSTGLAHHVLADGAFNADSLPINGGGPTHETPNYLKFCGEQLFMTAGYLDPTDQYAYNPHPFLVSWLDTETDDWSNFEVPYGEAGGKGPWLTKYGSFRGATSVAQDPLDPDHFFVTSARQGLFEYRGGKLVEQYTENHPAGVLRSCSKSRSYDNVRTSGAVFDKQGNLFLSNNGAEARIDTVIWCRKADGKWVGLPFPTIYNSTGFEKSIIDSKGRLWFTQCRTVEAINGGFLCMDLNGTIDNTDDDVYTYRTEFYNQDGTLFSFQKALAIAEDHTGRIWMGTETGLVVCDDPDRWNDPDFAITQVKVPRNDGTNFADYLLAGTPITAIAVDGADRKWIGTDGDGVYLVSADGIVTLHHFTAKNSPLTSDYILSIACHPRNGEVFIGTDKGLISYQSDASEAAEELTHDNLRVFPNPVRPDYSGPVILDGLVYDSDIKVVNTAGHVVAAGTSAGGTFTWNGRGPSGERVGSGVYYFMVASPDGKESTVAKVAVIR